MIDEDFYGKINLKLGKKKYRDEFRTIIGLVLSI